MINKLKYTALSLLIIFAYSAVFAAPQDHGVDYDIVYVRYPAVDMHTAQEI